MTLNRLGLVIGAGVLVLATSAAASPQNTNPDRGSVPSRGGRGAFGPLGRFRPLRGIAAKLDLTDAQKDQIKAISESHKAEWRAFADRTRGARQALSAAIASDQIDEGLIRQRSAEVAAVQADLAVARAHARAEIFQVLTPDQQAKARELRAQFVERVKERRAARTRRS